MSTSEEMIELQHPEAGKCGPRLSRFKLETYRTAILTAIPEGPEGMAFKDLSEAVRQHLPADKLDQLGKVTWHVVSVKLHLEATGEIERIPGRGPQRLRLSQG